VSVVRAAGAAGLLGVVLVGVAHASLWSDLWSTPDQQGEQLLKSGQAAAAAARFRDRRLRAYAELEAGHYETAARELAAFDDLESQYNRGNAFARAGQLEQALRAYDDVLARNPQHRDARHNRDLIARALARRDPASEGEEEESAAADQQGRAEQGGGTPSQDDTRRSGERHAQSTQADGQGEGEAGGADTPEGAQRDARLAASLKRESRDGQRAPSTSMARQRAGKPSAPSDTPAVDEADGGTRSEQPKSEEAIALEQWLRRIPEDPEGLLRRKFLIEHLMRQQGADR
jgi:Ca-activated chloride channel homolog